MVAFIFPGQGSQTVGMGKSLADAHPIVKRTFEEADDALGLALTQLCFEGPAEELNKTEITQPAILATSVAMVRLLSEKRPDLTPVYVAGHSLGEWSALVAAGAIHLQDALRLVRERGRLMQIAVPLGEGGMAAVMRMEPGAVVEICRTVEREMGATVCAANFNSPEQTVISGAKAAVEAASRAMTEAGAIVKALPVSAPFHCPLMKPAAVGLEAALSRIEIGALRVPVVSNVEAAPNSDSARVKKLLIDQVTAPVRWVEIVRFLSSAGVTSAIEVGPGKILAGLGKRIDKAIKISTVDDALFKPA